MAQDEEGTPRELRPRIGKYDQRPRIEEHVNPLPMDSPLRSLIADPAIETRLALYEDADADALAAQRWFVKCAGIALTLITIATIISGVMLFPVDKLWADNKHWREAVSVLQSAANGIALLVVWWLNRNDGVAHWIDLRAKAERLRGEYFNAVLAAPVRPGGDSVRLLQEKLAFVEFAHHDYQHGYLTSAINKHAKSSAKRARPRRLSTLATGMAILIGIVAAAAVILGPRSVFQTVVEVLGEPNRWQLGLNTMASALLAFASARSMIHQDDRNAALYRGTLADLNRVRAEQRGEAIAAAQQGDEQTVLRYTRQVQSVLDADHRAWRLARQSVDPNAPPPPKWKVW